MPPSASEQSSEESRSAMGKTAESLQGGLPSGQSAGYDKLASDSQA